MQQQFGLTNNKSLSRKQPNSPTDNVLMLNACFMNIESSAFVVNNCDKISVIYSNVRVSEYRSLGCSCLKLQVGIYIQPYLFTVKLIMFYQIFLIHANQLLFFFTIERNTYFLQPALANVYPCTKGAMCFCHKTF